MTEHEKLKAICDKIGYEVPKKYYVSTNFYTISEEIEVNCRMCNEDVEVYKYLNVREIIFTQEFMDTLDDYILNTPCTWITKCDLLTYKVKLIEDNLDNPVDYLYNLIK